MRNKAGFQKEEHQLGAASTFCYIAAGSLLESVSSAITLRSRVIQIKAIFFSCSVIGVMASGCPPLSQQLVNISNALTDISKGLHQMRKRKRMQRQVPRQVLTASMILFCRCGDKMRLLEFLKWKTAAEKEDLDRWACGVTKWRDQAEEHVYKLFIDGTATLKLRRAAAQVAKFTAELSLHSWVLHQNTALGICPDTAVVLQELPKHGLEGKPRHAKDAHRTRKCSRQFLRRWRRRWSVREGKIPIGEKVSLQELQAKVLICNLAAATTDPSSGLVRGPNDF